MRTIGPCRALRRGQRLAHAGEIEQSLAVFDAAAACADYRLLVQHALVLAGAGQTGAALAKTAEAAAAAPGDAVPAMFHACLLLRAGCADAAEAELTRAKRLSPENPIVSTLSAALDLFRGRTAEACRKLLDGPLTDNLEILGWILAVVERKIFEAVGPDSGALPPSEEHNSSDAVPDTIPELSAAASARRGRSFLESGKPKSALKYLAHAAELRPDDPESRSMYGAALFEAGEFEQAEAELARVPARSPFSGVAQFYRAANAWRLGRYETAIELVDTLPRMGDVVLYREWFDYIRAMALIALGRVDQAGPHLAAFIDAEPSLVARRLQKAIELLPEDRTCSTSS